MLIPFFGDQLLDAIMISMSYQFLKNPVAHRKQHLDFQLKLLDLALSPALLPAHILPQLLPAHAIASVLYPLPS
jgi:hypothetical protein